MCVKIIIAISLVLTRGLSFDRCAVLIEILKMQKVQRSNGGGGDRKIFAAASSLSPCLQSFGCHRTNDGRVVVLGVR